MISSWWPAANNPHDHQLPHNDSSSRRLQLQGLLAFFSSRVLRGGPRLLLQIAACIFTIVILFRMLPSSFGADYYNVLKWSSPDFQVAGELRIVAFGSQDLVGSAVDARNSRSTWTEQLCSELNCSSHFSFVPPSSANAALTSKTIYEEQLRALLDPTNKDDDTGRPIPDYSFIREQYPVPLEAPDLEAQVKEFLSRPPPPVAPRQTIWVFTFGTWDIWNLAAMPRQRAEETVDALASLLFSQVEHLYLKSLNPKSIAFSDFWSNATKAEVDKLTVPDASNKVDLRLTESFRVVVPQLFDITLTPGWHRRLAPPAPHSKAEQMRNAAWLTERWNSQVKSAMNDWMDKQRSKPEGVNEEEVEQAAEIPKTGSLLQYLPASLRPHKVEQDGGQSENGAIYAPYPRRAAMQSDPAAGILDAMTEEEMQRAGLRDGNGRGTLPLQDAMRFPDVWTACVASAGPIAGVEQGSVDSECEGADEHLFHDAFTVGQRAIEGLAKSTAAKVLEELFVPRRGSMLGRRDPGEKMNLQRVETRE